MEEWRSYGWYEWWIKIGRRCDEHKKRRVRNRETGLVSTGSYSAKRLDLNLTLLFCNLTVLYNWRLSSWTGFAVHCYLLVKTKNSFTNFAVVCWKAFSFRDPWPRWGLHLRPHYREGRSPHSLCLPRLRVPPCFWDTPPLMMLQGKDVVTMEH